MPWEAVVRAGAHVPGCLGSSIPKRMGGSGKSPGGDSDGKWIRVRYQKLPRRERIAREKRIQEVQQVLDRLTSSSASSSGAGRSSGPRSRTERSPETGDPE